MVGTGTALIIDDNPLNNDVLVTLLNNAGLETVAIESPGHLSDALAEMIDLQVIFLDLEFPNYDGFDVLANLRENPELNAVPIVAYSVHTSEIDRARTAGFDSFLGKPLNAQEFKAQLNRILSGESIWEI